MKRTKTFIVRIEDNAKTDYGIEMMEKIFYICLLAMKNTKTKKTLIKRIDDEKELYVINNLLNSK